MSAPVFVRPQDYITRVGSEFTRAFQTAATGGGLVEARAFASEHRGLVLSTILPLAIVARYPAAGIAALRIIGPAFIIASRIFPVQVCAWPGSSPWCTRPTRRAALEGPAGLALRPPMHAGHSLPSLRRARTHRCNGTSFLASGWAPCSAPRRRSA